MKPTVKIILLMTILPTVCQDHTQNYSLYVCLLVLDVDQLEKSSKFPVDIAKEAVLLQVCVIMLYYY